MSSHSLFVPNSATSPGLSVSSKVKVLMILHSVEQIEKPSSSSNEGVAELTEANLAVHNSVLAAKVNEERIQTWTRMTCFKRSRRRLHLILVKTNRMVGVEVDEAKVGWRAEAFMPDESNRNGGRGRSTSTRSPNSKSLAVKPKIAKVIQLPCALSCSLRPILACSHALQTGRRPISRLAAVEKRISCVKVEAWRRSVANGCNTVKYEGKLETELGKLERARHELRTW
eukprot:751839-Hanusia_phi.AAC.5